MRVLHAMIVAAASSLRDNDRAVLHAQQAIDEKDPLFVMLARGWPDYEYVKSDPRFRAIVARLNLPE